MLLHPCPACGQHVQRVALTCPHCGRPLSGKLTRTTAAVVMGLTLLGADDPDPMLMPENDYGVPAIMEPAPDADQDGITSQAGDCDDTNPDVFPGAKERWFDGLDSDCDGKNNR